MDHSLARGYATSLIQAIPNHQDLISWMDSDKSDKLLKGLLRSFPSKKPGRVGKRITPQLEPVFGRPKVAVWSGNARLLTADSITASSESTVLGHAEGEGKALFNERAVFLNTLIMSYVPEEEAAEITILTSANICHHAIKRLLERDYMSPEDMQARTTALLGGVRRIGTGLPHAGFGKNQVMSLMLPLQEGAIIVCTADVLPLSSAQSVQHQTMSIRTYLPPEMISDHKRERMRPLREALGKGTYPTPEELGDLLRENATPYSFEKGMAAHAESADPEQAGEDQTAMAAAE